MILRRLRARVVRLGGLFSKERRDRELAEELESHLRMQIEDNLRSGMSAAQARRDAQDRRVDRIALEIPLGLGAVKYVIR